MADLGTSSGAPDVEDFGLCLTLDVVPCPCVEDFGLWLTLDVVPCPFAEDFGLWLTLDIVHCPYMEAFITLDWSCSWLITKNKVK